MEGWVEGADLVFTSKMNSADYHDEMNREHYIGWLTERLLPGLDRPTVIILDNASYHNKQKDKPPTSNDRKDVTSQTQQIVQLGRGGMTDTRGLSTYNNRHVKEVL